MVISFSGLGAPSRSQYRFFLHSISNKAHIDFVRGRWRCVGRYVEGYGGTPREAFKRWESYAELDAMKGH